MSNKLFLSIVALAGAFACSVPVQAEVVIEWVTVVNPGNAEDPLNSGSIPGIGSVPYGYRIAKHEVTNDQYVEFLNAVAATDPNNLYSVSMASDARSGIQRIGSSGSFTYSVRPNMDNKPVNYMSFFDAMRFVNWLHNGQPTGAQDAGTTEDGVYAISDGTSELRARRAQFFIPTENEWYKAAFHQPMASGGDSDGYWRYPTASNMAPTLATANATGDISNPGTNVANYAYSADWNGTDGNVTTVGSAGPLSESFYGTSDQGGNAFEWTQTVAGQPSRVLRGGSWYDPASGLRSSFQIDLPPSLEFSDIGFRVARMGAVCGDGVAEDSEACDDGFTDDCGTCNADCTAPGTGSTCGDGELCPEFEECDGTDAAACPGRCLPPGDPAECTCSPPPPAPLTPDPEPFGPHVAKNRYISMVIPPSVVASNEETAIRVRLTSLHHPAAPEVVPDFSAWEGQYRWVNALSQTHTCPDSPNFGTTFRCAVLGCDPEYRAWAKELGGETLHVTGGAVVTSSTYHTAQLAASCLGNEATCTAVSEELSITTCQFGDVDPLTEGLVVLDIARVVDHVKGKPYPTTWPPETGTALFKPRVHLRPNVPDALGENVGVLDIATAVDAVKGNAYGHFGDFGPCTDGCPGEAPCP